MRLATRSLWANNRGIIIPSGSTAIVQTATGSTAGVPATTVTATLSATTQGNTLIAQYTNTAGSTGSAPAITSDGTLADTGWTKPDPPAGGLTGVSNTYTMCAYAHNIPGGLTQITFTTTSRDQQFIIREVSGLQNAAPAQAAEDLTNTVTTVTPASAAATITEGHFVIGWVAHGGNPATGITAVSTDWTLGPAPIASANVHIRDAYQLGSSGGTQQAVFSGLSAGVRYTGGLLAFAPAAVGAKTIGVSPSSFTFNWTA